MSALNHRNTLSTNKLSFFPRVVETTLLSIGSYIDIVLNSSSVQSTVSMFHAVLRSVGVPKSMHPGAEMIAVWCTATGCALFNYYILFGNRHVRRRQQLRKDLAKTVENIGELEDKLMKLGAEELVKVKGKDSIRIFLDGAFDLMHYGHMNAFRLGRSLGTCLVVGINSDESITKCKGAPVSSEFVVSMRFYSIPSCRSSSNTIAIAIFVAVAVAIVIIHYCYCYCYRSLCHPSITCDDINR